MFKCVLNVFVTVKCLIIAVFVIVSVFRLLSIIIIMTVMTMKLIAVTSCCSSEQLTKRDAARGVKQKIVQSM